MGWALNPFGWKEHCIRWYMAVMTTLCPQCRAVCAIPRGFSHGFASRLFPLQYRFYCRPFCFAEKTAETIRLQQQAGAPWPVFLILVGISGYTACRSWSPASVFCALSTRSAPFIRPICKPPPAIAESELCGFGMIPTRRGGPDDKNGAKIPDTSLIWLCKPLPPSFAIPAAADQQIDLSCHPRIGEFDLALQTWLHAEEKLPDGSVALLSSRTLAELTETVQAVDSNNHASVRVRYRGYVADASRDGASRTMPLAAGAPNLARAKRIFSTQREGRSYPPTTWIRATPPTTPRRPSRRFTKRSGCCSSSCALAFARQWRPSSQGWRAEWNYRAQGGLPFQPSGRRGFFTDVRGQGHLPRHPTALTPRPYAVVEIKGKLKSSGTNRYQGSSRMGSGRLCDRDGHAGPDRDPLCVNPLGRPNAATSEWHASPSVPSAASRPQSKKVSRLSPRA